MENDIQSKSRTQIKKEAEELQKLGEELTRLPIHKLDRMELPDKLHKALIEYRSITSHIASRRHRQFIGTLMRDVDPEPIRMALLEPDENRPVESNIAQKTRIWMDKLLTGDPAEMEAFIYECPGLERQKLRQLLRNIKKEKTTTNYSKSVKALEQLIIQSMDSK